MTTDRHVIRASKGKTVVLLAVSIGFVVLGAWLLAGGPAGVESRGCFKGSWVVCAVGATSVIFFGLCAVAALWRLFSSKPGLIVDSNGIELFAIGPSTFIPWTDVAGFSKIELHGQEMLVVRLHDPQKYIDLGGLFRRSMSAISQKMIGSPFAISSSFLAIRFERLWELCETYFERYGQGS
ncbi:MAG TPA: hypothetical protein ENK17_00010 [Anaerolineae bacterium]|nr:hypothetical protein [Anaerolineae bacterium]